MKIKKYSEAILLALSSIILCCLFIYRLDFTALASYDEAWYAEITRNLVQTKNPFFLRFNGSVFTDHPPFGYIVMAIPTLLFGSNELSTRLASALMGVGSILLLYFIGKKMGGRSVGIAAGAILASSMWFMLRARSGNLDVPFLFWEVLTMYAVLHKSKYAPYVAAASFAALFLTKTVVGLGLLPLLLFVLWTRRIEFAKPTLVKSFLLFLALVLPWYVVNQLQDPNFLHHHFFEIGTRGNENSYTFAALQSSFTYLAIGIGKWYKIFLVSLVLGAFIFICQKTQRFHSLVLLIGFLGFSIFLFSSKTEIWHLLPLYPFISLAIPFFTFSFLRILFKKNKIIEFITLVGFIGLAAFQFNQFSNLIYPKERQFSTEKDIATKTSKYSNLYLMETFYPAAVYYSGQNINPLHWDPNAYTVMKQILSSDDTATFIINETLKQQMETDEIPFNILENNSSYYLITQ